MEIGRIDDSQRTAAKVAGWTYLVTLAPVLFANYAVHGRLVDGAHRAAAVQSIAAFERLFRIGIACDLIYCLGMLILTAALYAVLRAVSLHASLLAALARLVYALMWILMTLNLLTALRLSIGAPYRQAFEPPGVQALAGLFLGGRGDQYYVGLVFWGVAATVGSVLWLKSRYVPSGLAVFGLLASIWSVACAFAYIVFPGLAKLVNPYWFDSPIALFEIVLSLWLVVKGLRPSAATELAAMARH